MSRFNLQSASFSPSLRKSENLKSTKKKFKIKNNIQKKDTFFFSSQFFNLGETLCEFYQETEAAHGASNKKAGEFAPD